MLDIQALQADDLQGLSPSALAEVAHQMLAHIGMQSLHIERHVRDIKVKDAKLERITFELARLKAWRFCAKTEAMDAEQRQLFEETLAGDQASLEAQLAALQCLQGESGPAPAAPPTGSTKVKPQHQALPEHLRRVEHRTEPESTLCPIAACAQPMVRVGEDVSERLDVVPAEFFVHRHIRGKWACRCCQTLVQELARPQMIDKGMPAPGLLAHSLVSRFVDHLPYYRHEQINARLGVHTPRATLAPVRLASAYSLCSTQTGSLCWVRRTSTQARPNGPICGLMRAAASRSSRAWPTTSA